MAKPKPNRPRPPMLEPDTKCNHLIIEWVNEEKRITDWAWCRNKAGRGTTHSGKGRCLKHDSKALKHGLQSKYRDDKPNSEDVQEVKQKYTELITLEKEISIVDKILFECNEEGMVKLALSAAQILGGLKTQNFKIKKELNNLVPESVIHTIVMRLFEAAKRYMSATDQSRFSSEVILILQSELGQLIDPNKVDVNQVKAIEAESRLVHA